MATITTTALTYVRKTRTFYADASDLKPQFDGPTPQRVRVTNPRTGRSCVFAYPNTYRDHEGDVTSIAWSSDDGLTLRIFND